MGSTRTMGLISDPLTCLSKILLFSVQGLVKSKELTVVRLATVRPENIQTVCKMLLHKAFLTLQYWKLQQIALLQITRNFICVYERKF